MSDILKFSRHKFIGKDIGVTVNINKFKDFYHPEHTHEFIEIAYMVNGEAVQYIDGKKYSFHRGQLLFINYGQVHKFTAKSSTKIIDVLIDPSWISEKLIDTSNAFELLTLSSFCSFADGIDTSLSLLTFDKGERTVIESILNMMAAEQKSKSLNYETALKSLTVLLLTHIFRKMSGSQSSFMISPEFLQFIRDHCNEKLTLSNLSKMCFYNPSYFSRIFSEHYGITLTDFIQNSRFERAVELLLDKTLSTDEIAINSGFGSKRTFYKIFREKTGMTPGEYREKMTAE